MANLTQFIATDAGFAAVFSAISTILATLLAHFLRGKVRLIWFSPNSTKFQIKQSDPNEPPVLVNSGQIIVQNLGRQSARDVQITSVPAGPPAGYSIVPSIVHLTRIGPNGEWIVEIPFLASTEVITIQILNGAPIDSVRSIDGLAKLVPVTHQRLYPRPFQILVLILMTIGMASLFFIAGWLISNA